MFIFHVLFQVPYVEINALMKTFKMKPLFFPVSFILPCACSVILHHLSTLFFIFLSFCFCFVTHLSCANSLYHLGLQLAGSVTAVFNCQGPLDAPVFVGSCMVSRKIAYLSPDLPASVAYESMLKNKEAGAVAAFDRVPFSYLSANFTFNTDNCVSTFYVHLREAVYV